jgi:hypothetical protein
LVVAAFFTNFTADIGSIVNGSSATGSYDIAFRSHSNPIPEPSAALLFVTGFATFAATRKRGRR